MQEDKLKTSLKDINQWLRILFMLFFAAILYIASTVVLPLLVFVLALFTLLSGSPNQDLKNHGADLSRYLYDVCRFLCYSTEEKPFPFADWPDVGITEQASDDSSHSSNTTNDNSDHAMTEDTEAGESNKPADTSGS